MNDFKFLMDVATGKEVADLAICNARLVNVYTGRIEDANVLVAGGLIARCLLPKRILLPDRLLMPKVCI